MQLTLPFSSEPFPPGLRLVRLGGDDFCRSTDSWRAFRELILSNEDSYPGIERWLQKKVAPGLQSPWRSAYLAFSGDRAIASAVLKRGVSAKFCHLRIDERYQGMGLGNIFFSLMALDARHTAREFHFTLPESLWEQRRDFFSSFGFRDAVPAHNQYRLFEQELRCSAPFAEVWTAVMDKLPLLMSRFSNHRDPGAADLLMSIQPRHAEKILSGEKQVEIRRRFSRKWAGHRVFVYASSPVCSVVGEATIEHVVPGPPEDIWNMFAPQIGCTKEEFDSYAGARQDLFALILGNVRAYEQPLHRNEISRLHGQTVRAPQSYATLSPTDPWARALSMAASPL